MPPVVMFDISGMRVIVNRSLHAASRSHVQVSAFHAGPLTFTRKNKPSGLDSDLYHKAP
jgi:hypothetical protein